MYNDSKPKKKKEKKDNFDQGKYMLSLKIC